MQAVDFTHGQSFGEAQAPPLRLNPSLPQELARIINKALERDLDLRYQIY